MKYTKPFDPDFVKIPIPMGINHVEINCEYLPELAKKIYVVNDKINHVDEYGEDLSEEKVESMYEDPNYFRVIGPFKRDWDREWDMLTNAGSQYLSDICSPYVEGDIIAEKTILSTESQKRQTWITDITVITTQLVIYEFKLSFYELEANLGILPDSKIAGLPEEYVRLRCFAHLQEPPAELGIEQYSDKWSAYIVNHNLLAEGPNWKCEIDEGRLPDSIVDQFIADQQAKLPNILAAIEAVTK